MPRFPVPAPAMNFVAEQLQVHDELMMQSGFGREVMRRIRDHWNFRAPRFDEDPEHGLHSEAQRTAWLQLLSRVAGDAPRRVLDVGCGTGVLTTLFAELGHSVTGVDLAPRMLERARERARDAGVVAQFRLENAAELSDPESSYDLVVARHVVWTLPDPGGTVREWLRVLRPGGCLAIIEGQWSTNRPAAPLSPTRKTLATFRRLSFYGMRPARWGNLLSRLGASFIRVARDIVRYGARPAEWSAIPERFRERRYAELHTRLPLYGGPSPGQLTALLKTQGIRDVKIELLMDPALWGENPQHQRYLAMARR